MATEMKTIVFPDSTQQYSFVDSVARSALTGKVNVEAGKGLSTNDYTDAEKALLEALDAEAVRAAEQSLSEDQQALVRGNIGAVSADEVQQMIAEKGTSDASGVYELIESITAEENAVITRTQEPDGTAYAFDAIIIRINTNGGAYAGSLYLKNGNTSIGAGYFSASDTKSKFAMESRKDRGYWLTDCYIPSSSAVLYGGTCRVNDTGMLKHSAADYPVIDTFTTSAAVPAGTVVEIWGVRYREGE